MRQAGKDIQPGSRRPDRTPIQSDTGRSTMNTLTASRMHRPRAWRVVAAGILAASLVGVAATPTQAAFPGANGPIALVSDRDSTTTLNDEIYLTDEHGSPAVRLTNHPATDTTPAVSPNGKQIAFASRRDTAEFPNPEGELELYVMDASDEDGDGNGDHLRRLTDNAANDDQPAWSPGGRKLAFHSTRDGNDEIYVLDADGTGTPTNLTNHPANDRWPEFSPDGTRLAFGSTRDASVAGEVDIWVLHLDGSGMPVNLTDAMVTNERWPAWSPDGTKLAFWSGTGNGAGPDAELYAVNADGTGTPINLTSNQAGDVFPDWGPTPTKKNR